MTEERGHMLNKCEFIIEERSYMCYVKFCRCMLISYMLNE